MQLFKINIITIKNNDRIIYMKTDNFYLGSEYLYILIKCYSLVLPRIRVRYPFALWEVLQRYYILYTRVSQ